MRAVIDVFHDLEDTRVRRAPLVNAPVRHPAIQLPQPRHNETLQIGAALPLIPQRLIKPALLGAELPNLSLQITRPPCVIIHALP